MNRQRYYPKDFLKLDREDVAQVTLLERPQGALGGKTVRQVLSESWEREHLERITRLARAWADVTML